MRSAGWRATRSIASRQHPGDGALARLRREAVEPRPVVGDQHPNAHQRLRRSRWSVDRFVEEGHPTKGDATRSFDARHGGVVALAVAELQDARVAAVAVGVARPDLGEELVGHLLVAQVRDDLAVVVEPALLGLGDDLLGHRAQRLGLGLGGDDALGGHEGRDEVGHHQPLVLRAAAEATALLRGGRHGVTSVLVLRAQLQAALVELLDDLVEGLLAEVGDGQEVVLGLQEELADRVHLRPLEAVAGALGQVEVLDGEVEVGRAGGGGGHLAELEALRVVAHVGDEAHEGAQGVAGGGERLAGVDGAVGLDVEHEPVVGGGLLDAGGLDLEGHPAHRREDRVDRDHADGGAALVAVGGHVATALRHGDVDGQAGRLVQRGDVQVGVEDLDVAGLADVAGGDVGRALHVEPQGDGLLAVAHQHEVLEVEDDVGDVLGDTGDGVELVERIIEAELRDGGAGDRRQEGAAQRVAERVAEAGLQRAHGKGLPVALGLADRLDGGALDDEHDLPRGLVGGGGGTGRGTTWSTARR